MLNEDRKHYLTASIAHIAMAGFELELEGMTMEKPDYKDSDLVIDYLKKGGSKLVRDIKIGLDIEINGKQITETLKYIKATTPVFSEGMKTAARNIAMSEFFEKRDDGFTSKYMDRGNDNEVSAIKLLEKKTGVSFTNVGDNQIFLTDGSLGVTPDGIEYNGFDIESCAEVKNPKDTTHMKYLELVTDQESLLEVEPKYYWQAQCGLAVTKAKKYHWCSRHELALKPFELVYVEITPNEEHIEILKKRADMILARVPKIIDSIRASHSVNNNA